jgi:hypothetical protein
MTLNKFELKSQIFNDIADHIENSFNGYVFSFLVLREKYKFIIRF